MSKYTNLVSDFISEESRDQYLRELRTEVFSDERIKSLIDVILGSVAKSELFSEDEFPLVAEQYDWFKIRSVLEDIVTSCGGVPRCNEVLSTFDTKVESQNNFLDLEFSLNNLLVQCWIALPIYLERYDFIFPDDSTPLSVMHDILVFNMIPIDENRLRSAFKLENNEFLSLDTGAVVRSRPKNISIFAHFISKSKAKLRATISTLETSIWDNIDFDGILDTIRDNTGSRYYNITTDVWVNTPTVKRMTLVNHNYKVVANKDDNELFNYIVERLSSYDFIMAPEQRIIIKGIDRRPAEREHEIIKRSPFIKISRRVIVSDDEDDEVEQLITSQIRLSESDSDYDSEQSSPVKLHRAATMPVNTESTKEHKIKRKAIPARVRQLVWRTHFKTLDGTCWCCNDKITIEGWHAGHVIPASKNGPDTVDNLRPLCASCNLSMSNMYMADFINKYGMKGKGAQEFGPKKQDNNSIDYLVHGLGTLTV
ncbi:Hypothetical protein HVR_LOCUS202 [uncultured virus]|nr:Hypothetical protein HVR_LOCUS202 [uncultured virus]